MVIDLIQLQDMSLDIPQEDGRYITLRERDAKNGVASIGNLSSDPGLNLTMEPYQDSGTSVTAMGKRRRADSVSGLDEKNNEDHFTKPCVRPHNIVWTLFNGLDWPAKVFRCNKPGQVEVRYFQTRQK